MSDYDTDLLELIPAQRTPAPARLDNTEAFLEFHAANPAFFAILVSAAINFMARKPGSRCGMSLLFGYARYELVVSTVTGDDDYRINNNHAAYYARLLMAMYPTLDGLFALRHEGFKETDTTGLAEAIATTKGTSK